MRSFRLKVYQFAYFLRAGDLPADDHRRRSSAPFIARVRLRLTVAPRQPMLR